MEKLDYWLGIKHDKDLYTIKEASKIISKKIGREIKEHNISYLIQYGKITKYKIKNRVYVDINELENYYKKMFFEKRKEWENKLGVKLDWELAFDLLTEKERTKHVHGIHPYKGKFIPQLVEFFLKKYFKEGDTVIDPFMGSGTTLVQCMEMGIHSIGIDISPFNCLIAEVKLQNYDIDKLKKVLLDMLNKTKEYSKKIGKDEFIKKVDELIDKYNKKYFNLEYKRKVSKKEIDEDEYLEQIMEKFYLEYNELKEKYIPKNNFDEIFKDKPFLYKWYSPRIRAELKYYLDLIKGCDEDIKKVAMVILSRVARSVRGTTHFDLATLKNPVFDPYYCYKHKKICRPVHTIIKHLEDYTYDVIERLEAFSKIKKDAYYLIINGDARTVNVEEELKKHSQFYKLYKEKKIDGLFTSPPYLGQIDYHEQHAYAYELFDIPRLDELEIGAKFKGTSKKAQKEYIDGITDVLLNMKRFLREDAKIFIVVNDKKNLYNEIFKKSGLVLIKEYKRPVMYRTERDRNPYYESIFELRMG